MRRCRRPCRDRPLQRLASRALLARRCARPDRQAADTESHKALFRRAGHAYPFRDDRAKGADPRSARSEEHTSELQSLMRSSYAVFCFKKKKSNTHMLTRLNITQQHPITTTNHDKSTEH